MNGAASPLRARLEAALAGHFRLVRQLPTDATGGTDATFEAFQPEHERSVVLRALPLEDAGELERFVVGAQLEHPHVLPDYGAFFVDGFGVFLAPLLAAPGEPVTLRELLDREGRLPFGDTILILRGVVRALVFGRERGHPHGPLDAGDVHLEGTHARVGGFGWELALAPHDEAFDLGRLAYEMLCGEPFEPGGAPVNARRRHLPAGLAKAVMACLDRRPERRPKSLVDVSMLLEHMVTPDSTRAVARACELGLDALAASRFSAAVDHFRDAVDLHPRGARARAGLALALDLSAGPETPGGRRSTDAASLLDVLEPDEAQRRSLEPLVAALTGSARAEDA